MARGGTFKATTDECLREPRYTMATHAPFLRSKCPVEEFFQQLTKYLIFTGQRAKKFSTLDLINVHGENKTKPIDGLQK